MIKVLNKFFDESKAQYTKSGFTNPYLAKELEKKKFTDLVKMRRKDRSYPEFKQ